MAISIPPTLSVETQITLTDGATVALNASLAPVGTTGLFRLAAAGDRTLLAPSSPRVAQKILIQHFASGGARTLTLTGGANGFRFSADIPSITQTTSGKTDYIGAIWNSTDGFWDVIGYVKGS